MDRFKSMKELENVTWKMKIGKLKQMIKIVVYQS